MADPRNPVSGQGVMQSLRKLHVQMRARSFGTEVPRDDCWVLGNCSIRATTDFERLGRPYNIAGLGDPHYETDSIWRAWQRKAGSASE